MTTTNLPTIEEYKATVDNMVASKKLSIEEAIILLSVFHNYSNGNQTHTNYLLAATNLRWRELNWTLNGLVQKGGIRKIDKYWYTL